MNEPPEEEPLDEIEAQLDWIVALCHRVAPRRSPFVQDAVQLHREGRFSGSVLLLLSQIEGLSSSTDQHPAYVSARSTILRGEDLSFDTRSTSTRALHDLRSVLLSLRSSGY